MVRKPGIPPVPKVGEDRTRFDAAVKEALEIIMGRRLDAIKDGYVLPNGWVDLLTDIQTRTTGAGTPAFVTFQGTLRGYQFAASDEVYGNFHIPHDWAVGTNLYMHVHWATTTATAGSATWRWTWSYARGYGIEGFSTPVTVDVTQAHCGIAYGHNIAEMTDAQAILPDNCETDGIIQWALKLQSDTLADQPFVFFADLHYQSDGRLTNERNRTFTKVTYEDDLIAKINEMLGRLQ